MNTVESKARSFILTSMIIFAPIMDDQIITGKPVTITIVQFFPMTSQKTTLFPQLIYDNFYLVSTDVMNAQDGRLNTACKFKQVHQSNRSISSGKKALKVQSRIFRLIALIFLTSSSDSSKFQLSKFSLSLSGVLVLGITPMPLERMNFRTT